ncbi:MAG TPA: hypothetical protein VFW71_15390 [Actinomycetota bacterium]|nr:hypothetical protein [Actinomycetota bacterium]
MDDHDEQPPVTDPPATGDPEPDAPGDEDHRPRRRWVVGAGLVVVIALVAAGVILGGGNKSRNTNGVSTPLNTHPAVTATASGGPTSPAVRLQVSVPAGTTATVIQQVASVLSARLVGIPGVSVTRQGTGVLVTLPPSSNAQQLLNLVQDPGTFEVRPVLGVSQTGTATPTAVDDPAQPVVLGGLGPAATETFSLGPAVLTGTAVQSAAAVSPGGQGWVVQVGFAPEAAAVWTHFTGQLACATGSGRQMALVLDAQVASAPSVSGDVRCGVGITAAATVIEGAFTQAQAQEFAAVLTTGPLPVPISVVAGAP